jgi:hypothetical protein
MTFKAFACSDNTLIAIFHNQEFGETITINQGTANKLEYSWSVSIDIDSDTTTGTPLRTLTGIVGADYELSLAHWANGKAKTVPFKDGFQINVWECSAKSCNVTSGAEWYAEQASKMIILRGTIPKININSKIIFSRYRLRINDKLTYKTDWISPGSTP